MSNEEEVRQMSKKLQFGIGLIILVVIISMALFPSLWTHSNPYATEGMRSYVSEDGTFHLEKAPFKPQWGIPMGTDELGRQVWALIVYGTRLTMTLALLIVIFRFVFAIPLGFAAGFGSLSAQGILDKLSRFFGTIPTLLLCIIILKMDYFINLTKGFSVFAFVVLLGFVGFGKLGVVIMERVTGLLKEPFVTGDIAIGKTKLQIATTTVIRHLIPEIIVMFFLEFARVLTLLMQLGLFAVFVGNVRFIEDTSNGNVKFMDLSYEPEWASMLGAARNHLRDAPWLVWFPSLAFFISVLGLNAFGEGLKDLQNGTLKLKKPGKPLKIAVSLILVAALFLQGQQFIFRNFGFEVVPIALPATDSSANPVLIGTPEAEYATELISEALSERGFTPLSGQMVHTYTVLPGAMTTGAKVLVSSRAAACEAVDLTASTRFISHGNHQVEGIFISLVDEDLYQITPEQIQAKLDETTLYEGRKPILLLDSTFYSAEAIYDISERISQYEMVGGIAWLTTEERLLDVKETQLASTIPVFYLNRDQMTPFMEPSGNFISFEQTASITGDTGRNVYAVLPGTDPYAGEEAIIYGFSYNALTSKEAETKIGTALGIVDEAIKNRKRTVIVLFFDGTLSEATHGLFDYAAKSLYSQKDVLLYMDLTRHSVSSRQQGVLLDQRQSPISRYYAYTFSLQLEKRLNAKDIEIRALANPSITDQLLFQTKGFPTMVLDIGPYGKLLSTVIKSNNY